MRFRFLLLLFSFVGASHMGALQAAAPTWLDRVAPIITPAEKKTWLSLAPDKREQFEQDFWATKAVTAEEYHRRLTYIDATFGSSKPGSGANTDPGRVYLALGPPVRITHIPSSRIFVPIEIWYYDYVPGILDTELRLMFYQKNDIGLLKLYSPTVDTIRALLLPQASTVGMFGPNDNLTESAIRQVLTVGPAEDEIVSASVGVATSIKYSGNDEILGMVTSPEAMLGRRLETKVSSRLILSHPALDTLFTPSLYGGTQVDLALDVTVQHELDIEVADDLATISENQLHLRFPKPEAVRYTHRLDLLPGTYRVVLTVDGKSSPYSLNVPAPATFGQISRVEKLGTVDRRQTPFDFDGEQLGLNPAGKFALIAVPHPMQVTWMVRQGDHILWRTVSDATSISMVEPLSGLAPGKYTLEAITSGDSRAIDWVVNAQTESAPSPTVLSYNGNLNPALRFAAIGHQWLLKGKLEEARRSLQASLDKGVTAPAMVELARAEALEGNLDAARDRVKKVLAAEPNNFEALSVFAYVETRFQDYAVAAGLYRRALAVCDSPVLRAALAKLPQQ